MFTVTVQGELGGGGGGGGAGRGDVGLHVLGCRVDILRTERGREMMMS